MQAVLGAEQFARYWAEGQAMRLEEAIAYALAAPNLPEDPSTTPEYILITATTTHPAGLTAREIEVLRLLVQGLTYAQIADTLVVSRRTVNAHATSIYSKLGVTSRAMATRLAVEQRLL
jgi:DNA-binding NarL/FixJ family response regulator